MFQLISTNSLLDCKIIYQKGILYVIYEPIKSLIFGICPKIKLKSASKSPLYSLQVRLLNGRQKKIKNVILRKLKL